MTAEQQHDLIEAVKQLNAEELLQVLQFIHRKTQEWESEEKNAKI